MADDVISRYEAVGQVHRLKSKSTQWRKTPYRDGWNDALESVEQSIKNCRSQEVVTVTRCGDCFHATDRESTLIYCPLQKKHKNIDAYCNEAIDVNS